MPNCNFYATLEDHEELLTWLLADGACEIYELASDFGQPLRRFRSAAEVRAQLERRYPGGGQWRTVYLQLYVLGAGPPFVPKRVALDPDECDGATFRDEAEGWGLVQLYLGALAEDGTRLEDSRTNHNTLKRAETWSDTLPELGEVAAWDFAKITAFSSRLNREIRKRAAAKIGSRVLLPGALALWNAGVAMGSSKPGERALDG